MRASTAVSGIRGIFPLIRSLAPQAISAPFTLSALRGLRLAIDATLLVQRLHFADDPHTSRHVIGFYRLITSMHQHGVIPMMVFDHPQKRLALKDREQVKRRHKRELDRIRSKLERERRGRLVELETHLDALSELQESERRHVAELLDQWRAQSQESSSSSVHPPSLPSTPSRPETVAYNMHTNWLQLEESLRDGGSSHSKGQRVLAEAEKQVYQTIAAQLRSGEAPHPLPALDQEMDTPLDATHDATPPLSLTSLNAMHHSLTKTYDRATSPLSASIYQDCAMLSSLMAVPVFWTGDGTRTGGGRIHEAEAYAASLVRSGFADLVASEDSDVLLYEAPLLRGLMGGIRTAGGLSTDRGARGKLEVVCGTRARTRLFPRSDLHKLIPEVSSAQIVNAREGQSDVYERLSRSLMLDFALLCGTDFNRTIPGIGPKTALRLLKEHGSISTILRKESKKFRPPDGLSIREYETEIRHARMVFLQPPKVRAAARSILGSAASIEAAASQSRVGNSVESVLFGEDSVAPQQVVAHGGTPDAAGALDAAVNTYCTAELALDTHVSELSTDTATDSAATNSTAASTTAPGILSYDRQRVHHFLRSHGVFRAPDTHPHWPLETLDHPESRQQEWRDLLDLELGLTSPSPDSTAIEPDDARRATNARLQIATLGADFFGERQVVACWQPHMEQQLRKGTSDALPNRPES